MNAKYYDHAKNQTNPAVAHAMARAKRSCVADGTALRIEANWPGKDRFYWIGCEHDVRELQRSLVFGKAENVVVSNA